MSLSGFSFLSARHVSEPSIFAVYTSFPKRSKNHPNSAHAALNV